MKILITGDEGFVGTNFKKHLDSKNNQITGIDIKNGRDVRDFFAKDDTKFDVVIHLAAAAVLVAALTHSMPIAI